MWHNLGRHVQAYRVFAMHFNFSGLPLQITRVCLFITHLAVQCKRHSTIKNYLNSLLTYNQLSGYPPLNVNNLFIQLTYRGILHTVRIEAKIARPLSVAIPSKMVRYVDFTHSIQIVA